jgi:3'(2'), 5'-bisphosphate nucleotidase
MNIDIEKLVEIAVKAGDKVMEIYEGGTFSVANKSDGSPLTMADRASHETIQKGLKQAYPNIPLLSEEGEGVDYDERKTWEYFWLVDPLDGTKEFIQRNGEFTVNIALIEKNRPVAGVICAPALKRVYYGMENEGAFKKLGDASPESIHVCRNSTHSPIAVRSRSHASEAESAFFRRHNVSHSIPMGSSLKFCAVAEGKAHVYFRHGPTMEWDTAAGHAIAESAGAFVSNLRYNKKTLKHGSFLVSALEDIALFEHD